MVTVTALQPPEALPPMRREGPPVAEASPVALTIEEIIVIVILLSETVVTPRRGRVSIVTGHGVPEIQAAPGLLLLLEAAISVMPAISTAARATLLVLAAPRPTEALPVLSSTTPAALALLRLPLPVASVVATVAADVATTMAFVVVAVAFQTTATFLASAVALREIVAQTSTRGHPLVVTTLGLPKTIAHEMLTASETLNQ